MVVRILFVDDDWNELEQLRLATRHKRDDWSMSFACGSRDALRHLASMSEPPDVVLSELDLDGIDGIELLQKAHRKAPESIRLLHSADPSTAALCRAAPWAHHHLAKPLIVDEFEATIRQLTQHPRRFEDNPIVQLAESVDSLPTLPTTYQRVMEIAQTSDFSLGEVASAIQDDIGLTAETIKLVNSSFFGLRSDVTSIEQAVGLLGLDVIRGLVLGNSLFGDSMAGSSWLDLPGLSERSQDVAALARALAKADGHSNRDQALAFLGGMVHGAGLLLLSRCPSVDMPASTGIEYSIDPAVDLRLFGVDRYALGAYLLRLWGFERNVVAAVAGLAVEPHLMRSPTARSLRTASELVAWGGFSVTAFVEGDQETRDLVSAMRQELDKRLQDDGTAKAA